MMPPKPAKPAPPPPPLSKEAITGSVPLRSFGQLKQLFDTRGKDDPEGEPEKGPEPATEGPPEPPPSNPET
jgi:uncharacterized protein